MASQDEIDTIAKLVEGARVAHVTTQTADGQLVSRPLAVTDREFDGDLYFFTQDPSAKTDQVRARDQVNVALQVGNDGFLSIAGTASVSRDQKIIDELWNRYAEAWFEQGREDPSVALLTVHADSAEYWTVNDPKVVVLLKYAKAVATGGQPDIADHVAVDL
ncbi:MAG TPA: pyridoxamine 5'-phosphate oxidase family protein [Microlunatus sp.]|nr:pyridoxamine 5'-phosphate oxidase family protein [Microlunatus sp.]